MFDIQNGSPPVKKKIDAKDSQIAAFRDALVQMQPGDWLWLPVGIYRPAYADEIRAASYYLNRSYRIHTATTTGHIACRIA